MNCNRNPVLLACLVFAALAFTSLQALAQETPAVAPENSGEEMHQNDGNKKDTSVNSAANNGGLASTPTPWFNREAREPHRGRKVNAEFSGDAGDFSPISRWGAGSLAKAFLTDQKQIWSSPAKLEFSDALWLSPLAGFTAGLMVTDRAASWHIARDSKTTAHYNNISNAGIAALLGGAAGMYFLSFPARNELWRETGFLAGEAAINSFVTLEALKYSFARQRPFEGTGSGTFFRGGTSFPSEHSAAAWSVAAVIAHEYPGPLTKIVVYSLASLIDYSRFRARQHFPSDIFIGSVIGNLVAQDVYTRHHDPELGGSTWTSIHHQIKHSESSSSASMGSPAVPLDSWIYPALQRLIALGYIDSAFLDMRPWTRFECARVVVEAAERLDTYESGSGEARKIYDALSVEFQQDLQLLEGGNNLRLQVESIYTRATGISGTPLASGYQYNFGQTIINDSGRPYEQGFNNISGFSAWASDEFFSLYLSGEFQSSPSAAGLTDSARQTIAAAQGTPVPLPPASRIPAVNRFAFLDSYAAITLSNWQLSFGKQTLWWGPGEGGSMMLSKNAAPITMFRISRVSPFKLPSILGWFGPMRVDLFLGQLSGQNFLFGANGLQGSWDAPASPAPMISGEHISFKPTRNLEFGFSLTTLFAGNGVPFTTHTYLNGIISSGNGLPGTLNDPGDRRSGFDLSYRLPFLRNWATFYADGFADDQFTPVAYLDRSAWTGGLYISHFPKISKLDLRMEGVYTDIPAGGKIGNGFFYFNTRFRSGYTQDGLLLGSWIGRQGQGAQAWANYWFTPKNRLQLAFRHEKVSAGASFIPGGGTITDFSARADVWSSARLAISASGQYESWIFPAIQKGRQNNFTTSVQLTYHLGSLHLDSGRPQ